MTYSEVGDINDARHVHANGNNDKKAATLNQAGIAKAMATYAASRPAYPPKFIITVGDNFYTKGVSSSTDPYWDYLYTNMYLSYESLANIPWYPVLGNHDWGYGMTGVQAQLDRTIQNPSGMWQMASTNYSRTFDIGDGETLLVIFCDTTTLAPSVNQCCNSKG
jgi:tartrate-resistant acid phosphatase type 5